MIQPGSAVCMSDEWQNVQYVSVLGPLEEAHFVDVL
jgi:hypothetical protein